MRRIARPSVNIASMCGARLAAPTPDGRPPTMIVCCIDTNGAHVVPGAATAPLETLAESTDEVCDARRARTRRR